MPMSEQVLVVDDDALIREMVSDMVRHAGCEPVPAASTHDAIGLLAVLQPMAVFLDLFMPEDPGDECCHVIKSNSDLAKTPVIFMTAAERDVHRGFIAGGDDFLAKPVRVHQVVSKLNAIRAGRQRDTAAPAPVPMAKTVLVADDDGFFRTLVGGFLERAGYRVVFAETGFEALTMLTSGPHRPDLCVVDLVMPGLGGVELIQKVRETHGISTLPMVVLSGVEHTPLIDEQLRKLGVDEVINKKSLSAGDVLAKVNAAFFEGENLRQDPRVHLYRVCEFRNPGEAEWSSGFVYNLSKTGVAVRTLTPPPANSVVDLRFRLGDGQPPLVTKASVAWASDLASAEVQRRPHGMGLRFAEIGADAQRWVEDFINSPAAK
ncbi:MAG: response regulator [Archangium sp.]|nr:response regulator [Archangium sp.]